MSDSKVNLGRAIVEEFDRRNWRHLLSYAERRHLTTQVDVPADVYKFAIEFQFIRPDDDLDVTLSPGELVDALVKHRYRQNAGSAVGLALGDLVLVGIPSLFYALYLAAIRWRTPLHLRLHFRFRLFSLMIVVTILCICLSVITLLR